MNTVVNSQCFYVEYLIGLRVKTALISAVYKKSTRLSNSGRKEMTGKFTLKRSFSKDNLLNEKDALNPNQGGNSQNFVSKFVRFFL